MYRYFHDSENSTVYRVPLDANVSEQKDRPNGGVKAYVVSVTVDVTRSDNYRKDGLWVHPVRIEWKQQFENIGNRYNREQAIENFTNNYTSAYSEIEQVQYTDLESLYSSNAKNNKG